MFNRNDFALLSWKLADTVPANALREVVGIVDDLYFGHLWLDLAEMSPQMFPDEYAPTEEETLYVNRLEIGSPNIIEFFGQASDLVQVFTYLGGLTGVFAGAKAIISIAKDTLNLRKTHLEIQKLKIEVGKLKAERRVEDREIDVDIPKSDLAERARVLRDRISPSALAHKKEMTRDIQQKAAYFFPAFCREPRLVVVRTVSL